MSIKRSFTALRLTYETRIRRGKRTLEHRRSVLKFSISIGRIILPRMIRNNGRHRGLLLSITNFTYTLLTIRYYNYRFYRQAPLGVKRSMVNHTVNFGNIRGARRAQVTRPRRHYSFLGRLLGNYIRRFFLLQE